MNLVGIRRAAAGFAVIGVAALAAGCGSSSSTMSSKSTTKATTSTTSAASGRASVLYAASLEDLMNNSVGPGFQSATRYTFDGYPDGSNALASDIKGKVKQGDVFISAAPSVNATLEGAKNGNWVSWYASFGSTALVLGYNTNSKFANQLKTKPWYQVVAEPGFRLGFTDPATDPKGVLAVAALRAAATTYNEPALTKIAADTSDQYPEASLVGELQSGQLDAGFFYTVEASAAKIPTVSLGAIKKSGEYTVTVLNHAPDPSQGIAFVKYLLSPQGKNFLKKVGLTIPSKPTVSGSGVPAVLDGVLGIS